MSTLGETILEVSKCSKCFQAIENLYSASSTHIQDCQGYDPQLETIQPQEIDRIISYYDRSLENLYTRIHLYAANYLSSYSIGSCAIFETGLAKPTISCITSNDESDIEDFADDIRYNLKSIRQQVEETERIQFLSIEQDKGLQADQSFLCLLENFLEKVDKKLEVLRACPRKIRKLLVKLKDVDIQTNVKLEELKLWKSKMYNMSAYSGTSRTLVSLLDSS